MWDSLTFSIYVLASMNQIIHNLKIYCSHELKTPILNNHDDNTQPTWVKEGPIHFNDLGIFDTSHDQLNFGLKYIGTKLWQVRKLIFRQINLRALKMECPICKTYRFIVNSWPRPILQDQSCIYKFEEKNLIPLLSYCQDEFKYDGYNAEF